MAQLYFPEEDEPRGLPAPAAKACCHGNNLFARQALLSGPGDGKDRSESQGFEVACFFYNIAWSYTNTRQVLFPANFHWRGLGH